MNNDNNNRSCPNFGDLLDNWQLRRELERERKRRKNAEMRKALDLLCGLISGATLAAIITFAIVCSGMEQETVEVYASLLSSLGFLFFSFSVAVVALNITLGSILRRNKKRTEK